MAGEAKRAPRSDAAKRYARTPGKIWRLLTWRKRGEVRFEVANEGVFDELVVDHWLHIEQMGTRIWWASVGDVRLAIKIETDGRVFVGVTRGQYGEPYGFTEYPGDSGHVSARHEPKRAKAKRGPLKRALKKGAPDGG